MAERELAPSLSPTSTLLVERNLDTPLEESIEVTTSTPVSSARKSKGVYPALIVGWGMVSRGEIGFLIANIAFSTNILSKQAFIITIWAILLNTILGPITVGLIVKLLGSNLTDGLWVT